MQNKPLLKFDIIKIQYSKKYDRSSCHLARIIFNVNNKKFEMEEYIDPFYNTIVTKPIQSTQSIVGNDKAMLLTEMSVKLHLTDNECKILLVNIFGKINILINKSQELRRIFPPLIDLILISQSLGFSFLKMTPYFHFIKTECDGTEQHICTYSISTLMEELEQYSDENWVAESYTYYGLMQQCWGYPDFFININNIGNGWLVFWWGEPGQYLSRHVNTLRDLAGEINYRKANSPY